MIEWSDLENTPRTAWAWKCCEIHGPATRAVQMAKFAEALEIELARSHDEIKRLQKRLTRAIKEERYESRK